MEQFEHFSNISLKNNPSVLFVLSNMILLLFVYLYNNLVVTRFIAIESKVQFEENGNILIPAILIFYLQLFCLSFT